MAAVTTDEELKAVMVGKPDHGRVEGAFEVIGTRDPKEVWPGLKFFSPRQEDLQRCAGEISARLRGDVHVVIPMREHQPTVKGVLTHLVERIAPERIIVVDNGSSDAAVSEGVGPFLGRGVRLIQSDAVLNLIDWERLCPVLALRERPTRGKGLAMLAGYLAKYVTDPEAGIIMQHDADVRDAAQYNGIGHLGYPLVAEPEVDFLAAKISRPGRGNETPMTVRNILMLIGSHSAIPEEQRKIAAHLGHVLGAHKWMLTGEFWLQGALAFRRPLAIGYIEETLTSIYLESVMRYGQNGHERGIAQVEASYHRLDEPNGNRKEHRMMDLISRFMVQYVLYGKPVTSWTLKDYQKFNERHGRETLSFRIPTEEDGPDCLVGPVIAEHLVQDRIIPPVATLWDEGFVNKDAARRLFQK